MSHNSFRWEWLRGHVGPLPILHSPPESLHSISCCGHPIKMVYALWCERQEKRPTGAMDPFHNDFLQLGPHKIPIHVFHLLPFPHRDTNLRYRGRAQAHYLFLHPTKAWYSHSLLHYSFPIFNQWSISGSLNLHFIEQWQVTLIITDLTIFLLRAVILLAQTGAGVDDRLVPLIYSVAFGFILYINCKTYLGRYVDLSKI